MTVASRALRRFGYFRWLVLPTPAGREDMSPAARSRTSHVGVRLTALVPEFHANATVLGVRLGASGPRNLAGLEPALAMPMPARGSAMLPASTSERRTFFKK